MNKLQEVYFEMGKLNVVIKNVKKSHFLLQLIVRQGVQSLNCKNERISFENLFAPNVAENPTKEVLLIVKLIKTINEISANEQFDINAIKKVVSTFNKNADLSILDDINFDFSLDFLFEIYKRIYVKQDEISNITISAIFNIFFIKAKLLNFPMLDISNALLKFPIVNNLENFYDMLLFAIKSTISIVERHKRLVKLDAEKVKSVGMKSVSLEYNYLIENPVVEVGSMLEDLEMTFATLSKATAILEKLGILTKIAGSQRYRVFKYDALCELFAN